MAEESLPVVGETESLPPPTYRFFSPFQVTMATAVGGPPAGVVLMALNYWRLGRPWAMGKILLGAFVCLLALGAVSLALPQSRPVDLGLIVGIVVAMNVASTRLQGAAYREHLECGGRRGTMAAVVAISLVSLLIVLALAALAYRALVAPSEIGCE